MDKTVIEIIAGPTAGGKSALALSRAKGRGVVINCDSRQIYRDLPILSAQPPAADKDAAPHRLYGCLEPDALCSAGLWRGWAMDEIRSAFNAGLVPIITGGNGLYLKTLMEGLSPIPPIPPQIRRDAVALQASLGNPAFHDALKSRDPETAALYHPMHTARLVHAWEVLEATGKPLAQWQAMPKDGPPDNWEFHITLVMPDRPQLYARCDARFTAMLDMGAAEELESFDARVAGGEIPDTSILIKTLGAEPLRAWRRGEIGREEAITRACTETRNYAKRQMTWFRNQIAVRGNIASLEHVT